MEYWRDVPNFEGLYQVSDAGQVRSLPRATTAGRILKTWPHLKGRYRMVTFSKGNARTAHTVHSLVLAAFIGPRPTNADTRHMDGNPENNALENLVYGTRSENMLDKHRHGTFNKPTLRDVSGARNPQAKLTGEQVAEIRRLSPVTDYRTLGTMFGVQAEQVRRIVKGERWAHA